MCLGPNAMQMLLPNGRPLGDHVCMQRKHLMAGVRKRLLTPASLARLLRDTSLPPLLKHYHAHVCANQSDFQFPRVRARARFTHIGKTPENCVLRA